MAERELFAIKEGRASSGGAKLVFGRNSGEPSQKVIPELAAFKKEDGKAGAVGAFIWQNGNLGELWEFQADTYQFILNNIDKAK
jgi:hypothetical protein